MARKRIGWDLRCLPSDGSPGAGIPHAARELWYACLQEAKDKNVELIAFVSREASLEEAGAKIVRLPSPRSNALRKAFKTDPIDLLFCPSGTVPFGMTIPVVPWIHDLAIVQHPEWFREPWWQRWFTTTLVRRGILRAPIVFAVSEATKREIIAWTSLEASRILVTREGIEQPVSDVSREPVLPETPYALMLGTVEPRKNIPFIQALWPEITKTSTEEISLVIAGQDGWGGPLCFQDPSIIRINDVPDVLRIELLRHARVVLVPSLYEGFGRVAAEALTLGIPVITSDRGALPEVVRSFGQCLPLDEDRWLKAIKETIKAGPVRQYWLEQARMAKETFSWPSIAKRVLANLQGN